MQPVDQLTPDILAERYGTAWNAGDLDTIMAMHGEDMVFQLHVEGFEAAAGPEAVRAQFAYFFEAWKDMHFETRARHLCGELFVNEFRFRAELSKPFPLPSGVIEPSGRSVDVDGVDVITIRDGRVHAKHTYMDSLGMSEQLSQ